MAQVSKKEIEAYIRAQSPKHGVNPETAINVYRAEGGGANINDPEGFMRSYASKNNRREPSYGPWQNLIGGPGTGYPRGQGNAMLEAGIDPRKPEDVYKAIDWSLDYASKTGWGEWYGAAKVGVGKWDGIEGKGDYSGVGTSSPATAPTAQRPSAQDTIAAFSDSRRTAAAYDLSQFKTPKATTAPAKTIASSANVPKGPLDGRAQSIVQAAIEGNITKFKRAAQMATSRKEGTHGFPYGWLASDPNKEKLGNWFNEELPPAEQAAFKAAMEKPEFQAILPETIGEEPVRAPFLEIVGKIEVPSAAPAQAQKTIAARPTFATAGQTRVSHGAGVSVGEDGERTGPATLAYRAKIAENKAARDAAISRTTSPTSTSPWQKRAEGLMMGEGFDRADRLSEVAAAPTVSSPARPYDMADFRGGYRSPASKEMGDVQVRNGVRIQAKSPQSIALRAFSDPAYRQAMKETNSGMHSGVNPLGQWSGPSLAISARPVSERRDAPSGQAGARPTIAADPYTAGGRIAGPRTGQATYGYSTGSGDKKVTSGTTSGGSKYRSSTDNKNRRTIAVSKNGSTAKYRQTGRRGTAYARVF